MLCLSFCGRTCICADFFGPIVVSAGFEELEFIEQIGEGCYGQFRSTIAFRRPALHYFLETLRLRLCVFGACCHFAPHAVHLFFTLTRLCCGRRGLARHVSRPGGCDQETAQTNSGCENAQRLSKRGSSVFFCVLDFRTVHCSRVRSKLCRTITIRM
jgi:hypothetical protein